jgi:hypothetical protein
MLDAEKKADTLLDKRTFRVVRNDGPGAEVNAETVFSYRQTGNLVEANYRGGLVALGRLVGVLTGARLQQAYVQVNTAGEIRSGRSTIQVANKEGRVRLIDEWEWDAGGKGLCILEEV